MAIPYANEVVVRNYLGQRLIIPRSTRSAFRRHGCFDWLGLEVITRALQGMQAPVALDIGANIGNHTLVLARHCSAVHAFEPQLRTGIRLADNVQLNGLSNVVLHDVGLSNEDRTETLHVSFAGTGGQSTFVSDLAHAEGKAVEIPLRKGDDLLRECKVDRVDLIKIDVEGYEARAMAGLAETIRRDQPLIFMEWNNDATREGFRALGLLETLFAGWSGHAIVDSHARSRYGSSLSARMRRVLDKVTRRRQAVLAPFDPALDYENVVFVPPAKSNRDFHAGKQQLRVSGFSSP